MILLITETFHYTFPYLEVVSTEDTSFLLSPDVRVFSRIIQILLISHCLTTTGALEQEHTIWYLRHHQCHVISIRILHGVDVRKLVYNYSVGLSCASAT